MKISPGQHRGGFLMWISKILSLLLSAILLVVVLAVYPTGQFSPAVTFVVDFSHSLNAQDGLPCFSSPCSRGDAIRNQIHHIISITPGYEYSLIGVAGESRILVPFTSASGFLLDTLSGTHSFLFSQGKSALLSGLQIAAEFSPDYSVLILFTDGEELKEENEFAPSSHLKSLIDSKHLNVLVVGMGSAQGSKVLLPNGKTLFINGKEKLSMRNDVALRQLSSSLNAALHFSNNDLSALDQYLKKDAFSGNIAGGLLILASVFLFLGL